MIVRTRFAPSPTGVLHLGSARTALFCWLYARHNSGQFVLRIEDTDRERSTLQNVSAILEGLSWLGLAPDEGPFYQTERFDRYSEVAADWLAAGKAYRCYCSKQELDDLRNSQMASGNRVRYDSRCRNRQEPRKGISPVIRFKNPLDGEVIVNDVVRGKVTFENAQLDDLIIARADGTPTYNFCVIIDDFDMRITHVIRGDDHLNNTPRQMNMLRALGASPPVYAHLPMILGPDGGKLSKRHGAVDIREYRDQGYLPKAMLNYLVRLGWSHGDQEIFGLDEMISFFDIVDVNQSASTFDAQKLLWINEQHIRATPAEQLGNDLVPFLISAGIDPSTGPDPANVANELRERADTLLHMAANAKYCYQDFMEIEPSAARKHLRPLVLMPLTAVRDRLAILREWTKVAIAHSIQTVADDFELDFGKIGQPIRVAVSGGAVSPPIDATVWLVGKERTIQRLSQAIQMIEKAGATNDT